MTAGGQTEVGRLDGLARLWGAVKFFHPHIVERRIDWDAVLERVVPDVRAAESHAEYRAALAALLAGTGDPATRLLATDAEGGEATLAHRPRPAPPDEAPGIEWRDGVAILRLAEFAEAFSRPDLVTAFYGAIAVLADAEAVVIDFRGAGYSVWMALDQLCGNLFAGELTLPGTRARMHSGYSADGSSGNLGGGAFTRYGRVINGNRASGAGAARAVFVVDETIPEGLGHILGLQVGGVGAIVFEGDAARMCPELHLFAVAEGIIAFIRAADWVHADGTTGFVPDVELPARQPDEGPERAIAAALALLASDGSSSPARPAASVMAGTPREAAYADEPYPSVERRLLALFRLWNVIRYFFPHVDLCDEPWDDLLRDFIPEMIAARDELEYSLALARACARMQDSHSSMSSRALGAYLGAATLPVSVGYVQGETVVTGMSQPVDGLTVGDVVVAVDGEQADVRRRRIGQYLIASHERGLQLKISGWVLNGEPDTTAEITVLRADGTHAAVSVPRGPRTMGSEGPPPAREVVELLRPDVAYIDLERLLDADVDRAFEAAAAAGTVILDGRGYPKSDAFYRRIGEFAGPRASAAVVFALAELPEPRSPNPELSSFREHMQQFTTPVPDVGDARITRLVILINERAISSAEHVCLLYEALFDVTYIGTPTAGANGNVSFLTLPGGASTSFTAHVIRHGDGRQLQRVGIQPHIYVEPTIDGIRAGRDEVLEAALEFLRD